MSFLTGPVGVVVGLTAVLVISLLFRYSQKASSPAVTVDYQTAVGAISPLAFPTADGFGKNAVGGRNGQVIYVTNLNDSGPGSLRACSDATGPRICLFRVGGTITLGSQLRIKNPYLTIAGQTAPGGGITLKTTSSGAALSVETHDVIVRYIRVRPGPVGSVDAFAILSGYNIVFDHITASWATDENIGITTSTAERRDITVQWSIISEGLHNSTHSEGPHSKGILMGDHTKRVSVHHNLLAHNDDRHPLYKGDTTGEFINNLVYNWQKSNGATHVNDSDGSGPSFLNLIGNHYIPGPSTPAVKPITFATNTHASTRIYVSNNIGPGRTTNSGDEWLLVDDFKTSSDLTSVHRTNTFATASSGITPDPVESVKEIILGSAGASIGINGRGQSFGRRDTVDNRIVNDVKNGTGRIINNPSEVGGWPVLDPGIAYQDDDRDGMGDEWEVTYFGNTARGTASNSSSDFDADGYTDLEEFLNQTDPKVAGGTTTPPSNSADLNADGRVDVIDLGILLSAWGQTTKPKADINQDGRVDVVDLGILLSKWG